MTDKQFYEANGYLVVKNVFSDAELDGVRRRVDEIVADPSLAPKGVNVSSEGDTVADKSRPEAANRSVRGMAFMGRHDPVFQTAARHPKLLDLVHELIGPRVRLFRDQMLLKPPGGQAKPMHQDQSYFQMQPEDGLVTAWIALDDATVENGCMVYVPGSHRHGLFEVTRDPTSPVHHHPITQGLELAEEVRCPVPRGSVIFHHVNTLHRSDPNGTDTWRRALIFHYATNDCLSAVPTYNNEVSMAID